ncbi:MAG: cytochrome c oxidase assembly protein [Geminicoccaceae bacterium]|nr:MAG: cytochrome c oxidase assembly protein [Geminicoccaceae bacterium]
MTLDKNTKTALFGVGIIASMAGLTAASVPLYDLFCRVTGYGGTTQTSERPPDYVSERTIEVRFNADTDSRLPWAFQPVDRRIEVNIGANELAFYRAMNTGTEPVVGTAVFNVTPFEAGRYFSKIACFCFEEQVLAPGESVDMPVSFYVDPAILDNPSLQGLRSITLSYTFFLAEGATRDLAARATAPTGG